MSQSFLAYFHKIFDVFLMFRAANTNFVNCIQSVKNAKTQQKIIVL
jgi:hypothetical protein